MTWEEALIHEVIVPYVKDKTHGGRIRGVSIDDIYDWFGQYMLYMPQPKQNLSGLIKAVNHSLIPHLYQLAYYRRSRLWC